VKAVGATEHLYIHLLVVHLPEQIRRLPVDPWYFQTSGLEHKHKQRKQWAHQLTNHSKPHQKGTDRTVSGYINPRTHKYVEGYVQGAGPGRIHQLARVEVVTGVLFSALSDPKAQLDKLEANRRMQTLHRRAALSRHGVHDWPVYGPEAPQHLDPL
jgi:hypothetical protein